jgi:hypothetical protein
MKLKARLLNELAFVVRLSALETVDRWEMGINTKPDDRALQSLRYRFQYQPRGASKPAVIEPAIQFEKELRSRKPELLADLPTFLQADWLEPISPLAASSMPYELSYPLGNSLSKFAVLTVPVPSDLRSCLSFQVRIISASKTREATFGMVGRRRV